MKFANLFLLASIFGASSSCYLDKIVNTFSGPVQGFLSDLNQDSVEVFLGIPFAEPPTGNLRFRKPKPVKPWAETLVATKMPPACIQYTAYPFPWVDALPGKVEDCLYLNIYAPNDAQNGSALAVLFWIFGGGFTFGSNRMEVYDASALAANGNAIVVTINYRLGAFGYVTANTEDAPGNVVFKPSKQSCMYDIVMALQWVNDNIESFGGDKKRITLFGESSGSIVISLLCVSPLTKGLFSKAIMQSGTGKGASYLAYVLWSFNPTSARSFFPQYGDEILPRNALDEIRQGNFHNVPLLIGNTKDEGSFQITTKQPELFGFFGQRNPVINKSQAENMIRGIFRSSDDPEKYVTHYLGGIPDDDYDAIKRQVYTASGDSSLLCETVYFAESYADRNNDVYFYFFTHRPSNTPWCPWMGTAHAEEIQFVFGRPVRKPYLYTPDEVELSKKMIEVWTNFAKNGIPSDSFKWPKYSKENHAFVRIDTNFKGDNFGTGPHLENCNIMRDFFEF
ncbi:unnamed protein product [Larinioides sclopetarius]|uniref:Carboxylic ester hydrolase n=1 Tax=Larinioides sclopetarius TaxID=280406 RepID=A0AAV1Z1R0_9ARAC